MDSRRWLVAGFRAASGAPCRPRGWDAAIGWWAPCAAGSSRRSSSNWPPARLRRGARCHRARSGDGFRRRWGRGDAREARRVGEQRRLRAGAVEEVSDDEGRHQLETNFFGP